MLYSRDVTTRSSVEEQCSAVLMYTFDMQQVPEKFAQIATINGIKCQVLRSDSPVIVKQIQK